MDRRTDRYELEWRQQLERMIDTALQHDARLPHLEKMAARCKTDADRIAAWLLNVNPAALEEIEDYSRTLILDLARQRADHFTSDGKFPKKAEALERWAHIAQWLPFIPTKHRPFDASRYPSYVGAAKDAYNPRHHGSCVFAWIRDPERDRILSGELEPQFALSGRDCKDFMLNDLYRAILAGMVEVPRSRRLEICKRIGAWCGDEGNGNITFMTLLLKAVDYEKALTILPMSELMELANHWDAACRVVGEKRCPLRESYSQWWQIDAWKSGILSTIPVGNLSDDIARYAKTNDPVVRCAILRAHARRSLPIESDPFGGRSSTEADIIAAQGAVDGSGTDRGEQMPGEDEFLSHLQRPLRW